MEKIKRWFLELLHRLFGSFELPAQDPPGAPGLPQDASSTPTLPPTPSQASAPVLEPSSPTVPPTVPESEHGKGASDPDALLPWIFGESLTHNNWHNVRALCDLEGLTWEEKESLTATVWGESEFNTAARMNNRDSTGAIWSVDRGICQWNDYWHGLEIPADAAVNDPERAVRLMCKYWKRGEASRKQWVAYSSGRYKQFLGRTL